MMRAPPASRWRGRTRRARSRRRSLVIDAAHDRNAALGHAEIERNGRAELERRLDLRDAQHADIDREKAAAPKSETVRVNGCSRVQKARRRFAGSLSSGRSKPALKEIFRERENADADGRNRQREAGADPRPRFGGRTMSR